MNVSAPPSDAPRRRHLVEHVGAVLVLAVLTLVFFWPAIGGGRMFTTVTGHMNAVYPWAATPSIYPDVPQSDQADLSYPWHVLLDRTLDEGTLPLWDPHSFGGGYPLFSNGSSGQAYLPRLVLAETTSPATAHLLFAMFHVFLGGAAMYALCRHLRLGLLAGMVGATCWAFGSFNLGWLHLEVVTPMILFVPLGVLAVRWAVLRRAWWAHLGAGLVLGGALLSGHILWLGITFGVALAYGAALLVRPLIAGIRARERVWPLTRPWVQLASTATIAVTSAAVVLVPTALALSSSSRARLTYAELEATQLADTWSFLRIFRTPEVPMTADGLQHLTFIGTLAGVLAIIGLFTRRPGAGLGRGLTIVLWLVAIGTPLTWIAFQLPGMNVFRPYTRLSGWFSFGLCLLAAAGADQLARWIAGRWGRPWRSPREHPAWVLLPVAAVLLVGVNSLQLLRSGRHINPLYPPRTSELLYPATPLTEAIAAEAGDDWPARFVPVRRGEPGDGDTWFPPVLYAAEALVPGLDSGSGYDSTLPIRTANLVRAVTGEPVDQILTTKLTGAYIPQFLSAQVRYDLLARLGYGLVVTPPSLEAGGSWGGGAREGTKLDERYAGPDGVLYEIVDAEAGPRVVGDVQVVADDDAAFRRFTETDFPWTTTVVLTQDEAARLDDLDQRDGSGKVIEASRGVNTASVTVEADAPALLVLPASWDEGWHVTVDGTDVPLLRGNYQQQVVPVPEGTSTVELRFEPPGLRLGAALTLGSWLAFAIVGVGAWRRRRSDDDGGQLDDELVGEELGPEVDRDLVDGVQHA